MWGRTSPPPACGLHLESEIRNSPSPRYGVMRCEAPRCTLAARSHVLLWEVFHLVVQQLMVSFWQAYLSALARISERPSILPVSMSSDRHCTC